MIVVSLSCNKGDIIEKGQSTWNHLGVKVIPDELAGEGNGKLCVVEVKKIIKIMEKMTRND